MIQLTGICSTFASEKKKQQTISNNLKIKEYETNYIILIDGSS